MAFGNIHNTILSVSGSLIARGQPPEEVAAILEEAVGRLKDQDPEWRGRRREIRTAIQGALKKDYAPPKAAEQHQPPQEQVVNLGAERAARAKLKPAPKEKKSRLHIALGEALLAGLRTEGVELKFTPEGDYRYGKGLWRLEIDITPWLNGQLEIAARALSMDSNIRLVGEARAWLLRHPDLRTADVVAWDSHGQVATWSGLIDPLTGQVTQVTPEHFIRRYIGADFDPAATCPRFEVLLYDMLGDSARISLVQEWLGAALSIRLLNREERRALIMVGPSRTGKTELARIFALLLGRPIATPSVADISDDGNRFALQSLYGSAAWIRDDAINEGDKINPQRFKTIVTGEGVDVGLKHRDTIPDFHFEIPVCLTCNSLPRAVDGSDAIYNRSIILRMTNVVDEQTAAMHRAEHGVPRGQSIGEAIFADEGSGILNWALTGLRRLRERGYYDIPDSIRAAIAQFKDDNNPVGAWASEAVEVDPWSKVGRHDLTRSYNGWQLEQEGDRAVGRGNTWLLPKLRNLFKGLGDMKTHSGKKYITGIRLTAVGLASWESYEKALPRGGAGGLATTVKEVNQAHDSASESGSERGENDVPF